jgi:endonuclease/exonuclease/phosphatase family metal-dependent hydrolase
MIGKVESGIVVASSFKVNNAVRIQLPGEFSWPVRLANLKRALIVSRLPVEGSDKELVVINGHLSAYDDGSMRTQEMERLKGIMAEEYGKGNYVIVGGDFNQTFPEADGLFPVTDTSNFVAPVISGDFLPAGFRFAVDLTLPTSRLLNKPYNPSDPTMQYYLIDGFIISDNITLNSVTTLNLNFRYSDHNPVVMEVMLGKSEQE